MSIPIPLGGTSTHFKTEVLRELHGWEALNVTAESDLDMRLADKGYRVGVVDPATFSTPGSLAVVAVRIGATRLIDNRDLNLTYPG